MHFWIDKPAGRNYGFGGRRYPCASSAPKSRTGQRGRRGREIGPMVTPVHRFQSLNGPASASVHSGIPGPSAATRLYHHHHHQQQQQHPQHQQEHQLSQPQPQQQQQSQHQQQPLASTVAQLIPRQEYEPRNHLPTDERSYVIRGLRSNIVTSNNVTNAAAAAAAAAAAGGGAVGNNSTNNERQIITNDSTSNGLNSRANFFEGHCSEISDAELAGYRLRCGVWITFVLATGFVSVAKYYFGNRDAGLDMLIFCGLLFTLLLSGCFYSTLSRRAQNTHRHRQDHLEQDDHIVTTLTAALTMRDDNARGFQVIGPNPQSLHLQMQQQQQQQQQQQPPPPPPPPPPPYHIAILIPPSNSPEEAPPPSYDKAMNEDSSNQTRVFIFSKDEDN